MKKTYLASTICETAGEAILISYTVDKEKRLLLRLLLFFIQKIKG